MNRAMAIWNTALDFLFPRSAISKQLQSMPPEKFCAKARSAPVLGKGFHIPFSYRDPLVKTAIWEVKYRGNRHIAELLGTALYNEMLEALSDWATFSDIENIVIVPIPLSAQRFRERGFNQTELIARALSEKDINFHLKTNALIRIRDTKSQTRLSGTERQENVRGCFAIKNSDAVRGKHILLVDDVMTTGATMQEAKSALRKAGARSVLCVACAH